jgi:hypothetical protein
LDAHVVRVAQARFTTYQKQISDNCVFWIFNDFYAEKKRKSTCSFVSKF